jgi:hypothetical protein
VFTTAWNKRFASIKVAKSLGSLTVVSILATSDTFARFACGSVVMFVVDEFVREPAINHFKTQSFSQFKALRCEGIIGGVIPLTPVIQKSRIAH